MGQGDKRNLFLIFHMIFYKKNTLTRYIAVRVLRA